MIFVEFEYRVERVLRMDWHAATTTPIGTFFGRGPTPYAALFNVVRLVLLEVERRLTRDPVNRQYSDRRGLHRGVETRQPLPARSLIERKVVK